MAGSSHPVGHVKVLELDHVKRQMEKWRPQTFDWERAAVRPKTPPEDLVLEAARQAPRDLTVLVGGCSFRCRAAVLAALCPALRGVVAPGAEITLPREHVTPRAFRTAYEWMLTAEQDQERLVPKDARPLLELLAAARRLGLPRLAASCATAVRRDASLAEHRAVLALAWARRAAPGLRLDDALLPRVRTFFLPLASSRLFLRLSAPEVAALLASDHLQVHAELEVFFAAVRWLKHGWPARREHVPTLARHVRFCRMSLAELAALRRARRSPSIKNVVCEPEVQRLIADGLSALVLRLQRSNDDDDVGGGVRDDGYLDRLAEAVGCHELPPPRDYRDEARCPMTYRRFLADLRRYRENLPADWPDAFDFNGSQEFFGDFTDVDGKPSSDSGICGVSVESVGEDTCRTSTETSSCGRESADSFAKVAGEPEDADAYISCEE